MEHEFWHEKWETNEIGFHQPDANPMMVHHFPTLSLAQNSRVFLPLCGKSLDIHWVLAQGYKVVGAELSEIAIRQLFDDLNLESEISEAGSLKLFSAPDIDIYVGDFFDLTPEVLGPVDAVYDRAALVAFPTDIRTRYAHHLSDLTSRAPQLLLCFEYDQTVMSGPPFSIADSEVQRLYEERFTINRLADREVPGGLKGVCPAIEVAWHLKE